MNAHLSVEDLLAYWLHETDPAATAAADEHLLHCDACGRTLDELVALGDGVRAAFRAGAVLALTSGAFVDRLSAQGLRLREYRLPHNGSVNCTVAPDDDLLVAHLEAPLRGVARLDARARFSFEPDVEHALRDLPFDAQNGEVLYMPRIAEVRQMPAHTLELTLLAVDGGESRELGRYTFRHRPWAAG